MKRNLLCRAFSEAFESRNGYSSVTTQLLALHFVVAMCRIFLPPVCNCSYIEVTAKKKKAKQAENS